MRNDIAISLRVYLYCVLETNRVIVGRISKRALRTATCENRSCRNGRRRVDRHWPTATTWTSYVSASTWRVGVVVSRWFGTDRGEVAAPMRGFWSRDRRLEVKRREPGPIIRPVEPWMGCRGTHLVVQSNGNLSGVYLL